MCPCIWKLSFVPSDALIVRPLNARVLLHVAPEPFLVDLRKEAIAFHVSKVLVDLRYESNVIKAGCGWSPHR